MFRALPWFRRSMLQHMTDDTEITMHWMTWPSGTVVDPTTGAKLGTGTPQSTVFHGFVHFVGASSSVRQFREVEVGDAIVDIPPNVVVDGLEQVYFEIGGNRYVAKDVPDTLAKHWDAMVANVKLNRTLLLRKSG